MCDEVIAGANELDPLILLSLPQRPDAETQG
jgi:hypothetical protein